MIVGASSELWEQYAYENAEAKELELNISIERALHIEIDFKVAKDARPAGVLIYERQMPLSSTAGSVDMIHWIQTHPAKRGGMYAVQLLRYAVSKCRADRLICLIKPSNTLMARLVQKHGFVYEPHQQFNWVRYR